MLDEDVAEATLKAAELKSPLVIAEVRLEERDFRQLAVKSGQVSSVSSLEDSGMNVRIVLPTGIGFASSNAISKAEGARLVKVAFRLAKNAGRRTRISLSSEPAVKTEWVVRQKRPLADVGVDEKLSYIRAWIPP